MVQFASGCQPQDAQHAVQALATIHVQFWNDPHLKQASGVDALAEFPFVELWAQYPQAVAELLPDIAIPPQFFAIGDAVAALHEYHTRLMQAGVVDYGFKQCWLDYRLAVIGKLYVTIAATVLLDNFPPFKRAWRRTDLERLLAFCEDHAVGEWLASL